ncbi:MAG: UDP-N-acetylmuramoyl-L-alanyl-D-glutamate--2,6-diaminopimelate ligase [Gammaproteobacteria bacterium]|nr:UDP-N-acetylmuramoyl-L-alanyl-D-glutamate--2,6-diaminopimelate ligase [Gammaproteobacteria bacterium]
MMAAMKLDNNSLTLKQLLDDFVSINYVPDIPVTGICMDSRKVRPGDVFVALAGETEHGLAYAEAAVNSGAVAVICDRKFDQYCQQVLSLLMTRVICVPILNLKERLGEIASRFYAEPTKDIYTIGITGTDGKTSVSHFIAQALNDETHTSAVIGTVGNGMLGELSQTSHTTPNVIDVHRLFSEFRDAGVTQVAMEVSSHGLDQGRVDGVDFDVAVLTNLGRDHMDYHGDMDAYSAAKKSLFERPELRAIVVNIDDAFGRQLAADLQGAVETWVYGIAPDVFHGARHYVFASNIEASPDGIKMQVRCPSGEATVALRLMGEFNAYNAMATLAVMLIQKIPFKDAIQRLQQLRPIAGRMEIYASGDGPRVVVDYAHTPQALSSALSALRQHCTGKIICVFGCGGDRDKGKRPLMAQAAEQYADKIIVTDDNPRSEAPQIIVSEILGGFSSQSNVEIIHDRKQAIECAMSAAKPGDMVLIAGKGHEDYQIIGQQRHFFSDAQVVTDLLGVTG